MKKLLLMLTGMVFALTGAQAYAEVYVTDAPHNATMDITCGSCHSYSLWWAFSPAQ